MTEPREPEFPEGGERPVLPTPPNLPAAPLSSGEEAPAWSFGAPRSEPADAPQPVAPEPAPSEPTAAPEAAAHEPEPSEPMASTPQVPEAEAADQQQGSLLPEPPSVHSAEEDVPAPDEVPSAQSWTPVREAEPPAPEPEVSAAEPDAPAPDPEPWTMQTAEHEPDQPWQPVTPQSPAQALPEDTAPMARIAPIDAEAAQASAQPEQAAAAEPEQVGEPSRQPEPAAVSEQGAEPEPTVAEPTVAEPASAASEWQPPAQQEVPPEPASEWQASAPAPELPQPPRFVPQSQPEPTLVTPVPVPEPEGAPEPEAAPIAEPGVWTHAERPGAAAEPSQPAASEWAPVREAAPSAAGNAADQTVVTPAPAPGVFASPAQEPEATEAYPATSARSPLAVPGEPQSDEDDGIFRPYAGAIGARLGAADQNDEERKLAAERNALREARAAALTSVGAPEAAGDAAAPVVQQVVEVKRTTDGFWGSLGLFLLRLVLAGVFGVWGVQMLLDPAKTQSLFATTLLSYPILATIVPVASLLISVSMVIGLATRYAAFGAMLISVGALVLVYWGSWSILLPNSFGFYGESELLIAAASLLIVFVGAGGWSLDGSLRRARAADKAARVS